MKADLVSRILEYQKTTGEAGQSTTDLPAAGNKLGAIPADSEIPSSVSTSATPTNGEDAAPAGATTATDPPPAYEDVAAEGAGGTDSTDATAGEAAAASLPDASATNKAAEAEKRAQRLKRFGGSEDIAKLERAERFGISGDAVDAKVSRARQITLYDDFRSSRPFFAHTHRSPCQHSTLSSPTSASGQTRPAPPQVPVQAAPLLPVVPEARRLAGRMDDQVSTEDSRPAERASLRPKQEVKTRPSRAARPLLPPRPNLRRPSWTRQRRRSGSSALPDSTHQLRQMRRLEYSRQKMWQQAVSAPKS